MNHIGSDRHGKDSPICIQGVFRDFAEARERKSRPGSTGATPSAHIKRCAIEARWSGALNDSSSWLDVEGALHRRLTPASGVSGGSRAPHARDRYPSSVTIGVGREQWP
jgi:hypothetical protein